MVDFVSKTWGQFQFFYLFNLKTWESMWLELMYSSFWILLIALINLGCRALKNKLYSLSYISNNTSSGRVMQLGVFLFLKFFGLFYSEYLVKLEFMYRTFFKFFWLAWYIWLWGVDVVRDDPTNNVPDAIFLKLGMQLHRREGSTPNWNSEECNIWLFRCQLLKQIW